MTPFQGPSEPAESAQLSFSAVNVLKDLVDVPEAIGYYVEAFVWEISVICSNKFKR